MPKGVFILIARVGNVKGAMSETKLGQLADGSARRDAVHVAVMPIVASETLTPGQRVRIDGLGCARIDRSGAAIGIVDPFLIAPVERGERFFLCLFPGTTTGLRHVWRHPEVRPIPTDLVEYFQFGPPAGPVDQRAAFEAALRDNPYDQLTHDAFADWLDEQGDEDGSAWHRAWTPERQRAEEWLREFADRANITFKTAVTAGYAFVEYGDMFVQYNEEKARDEMAEPRALKAYWTAWKAYTGRDPGEKASESPFTCSC